MKIRTSQSVSGWPALWTILQRRIARSTAVLITLVASVAGSAIAARAQEEQPQIIPGERKAPKKKDSGPRAVGVLQMAENGKASLVPLAILINGKFWDASAYKADPVPMALESGTVYEAERAGNSLGLFTVSSALHRNDPASGAVAPWIGTGTFHANGSDPEPKPAKAEGVPLGIDTSEGPPRLTRDTSAKDKPPDSAAPASGNAPAGSNAPASAPKSNGPSSDEPPRLSKPASAPEPPADSGPGAKPSRSDSEAKPGDAKAGPSKADDKTNVAASDSGASEGNRPRLRRGKPAETIADEDVPGYSRAGAKLTTTDLSKTPVATQGDVQLIPAISDARGAEIHSFVFQWLKGEEDDRRKQMTDLAKEQLRAYLAARAKADTTAVKTVRPATAKSTVKDPILENVRMIAYDLWLSNQPVMVLTAEGRKVPPAAGVAHSEVESEMRYSVVLVAYPDIYGNLHKLHVGITDKFHLDMTPRLELIDALDADGDNRGELLFRETSDQGTGWVIYRATADKLWKMFDSLSSK